MLDNPTAMGVAFTCVAPIVVVLTSSIRRGKKKWRRAHGSGVVKLFLCFDRRPSFLTQRDVSSRLLCENPVVRDKNFRLVTSLALVSTALVKR